VLPLSEDLQQARAELGGNLHVREPARRANGVSVGVDERDAGRAAVDVEIDQFAETIREGAVQVVAEQLGDLTTLDL